MHRLPHALLLAILLAPSSAQIREARDIAYRDARAGGVGDPRTRLDVYSPAGGGSGGRPVVLWIHGGGWRIGDKARVGGKPQLFADAGYVLVSVNYRMHPQVEVETMAADIAAAIRWTRAHATEYGGNGEELFLMGHSAGAHLAALVATDGTYLRAEGMTPADLAGVVLLDGAGYDVPANVRDAAGSRGRELYTTIFSDDPERQRRASPITHVAADKGIPPFLIVHVAARELSADQSGSLADALRAAGMSASVYPAEGKTHATLNRELGAADDEPTRVVLEFLALVHDGRAPPDRMHGARAVRRTLQSGGRRREYLVHASDERTASLPVVLVFHGGGGNARQMERTTGFSALAEQGAFIAVYPEGIDGSWNDGREVALPRSPDRGQIDDVAFTRAVVDALGREGEYDIDRSRIFATGISNGAFFSHRLAAEASDLFSAIAPVVGGMAPEIASSFAPEHPVSLLLIQGDSDPLVPLEGGRVGFRRARSRGEVVPTRETVALYLERFGLADRSPLPSALPDTDPTDGTVTWDTTYAVESDAPRVRVRTLVVEGGGHTWPGSRPTLGEAILGLTSRDFDATRLIWEFFASCPPRLR